MSSSRDPGCSRDTPWPADISPDTAIRLLPLGVAGPRRPVDDLISRLGQSDGTAWFDGLLAAAAVAGVPLNPTNLGTAYSIESFRAMKERSKADMAEALTNDQVLRAAGVYFIACAGALAVCRECISSRSREELSGVLTDLAEAVPDAWAEVLLKAAMVALDKDAC